MISNITYSQPVRLVITITWEDSVACFFKVEEPLPCACFFVVGEELCGAGEGSVKSSIQALIYLVL